MQARACLVFTLREKELACVSLLECTLILSLHEKVCERVNDSKPL